MEKLIISLIVITLFSLFGLIIFSCFIHENIHRFDFRNVEKTNEDLCYFSGINLYSKEALGYYYFDEISDEIGDNREVMEIKAYIIQTIFLIVGMYFIFNFWIKYLEKK